jgi:tetratricopeptide (TPR) repeat protein
LKRLSIFPLLKKIKFLLFALVVIVAGCSLEKQSGFNRSMQNLTAHYNILFNAKEILRLKQQSYAASFVDNYNEILNVYPDTIAQSTTPDKDLEQAITKGNTIINIKEQSHYLGDAYLVIGKANYLEGNYFNAVEFLSYVIRSFPKQADLAQDALVWKTRALMYLNQLPDAKLSIDTALRNINPKKKSTTADVYATKLQYDINVQEYADAEEMAKQAIPLCHDRVQRLRLTFILSQVEELNKKPGEAFKNYTKIAQSNASFEMAFNASLNCIRIEESQNGVKISREDRLLALLIDPNNKEFKDQIYYQVAEIQLADKDIDNAVKNYKLSVRNSVKNQNQKGLSYLRLAQIYFKNKADYLGAKKYYDSTLTTLPTNYPGYLAIQKTGSNLQLLADRLLIIAREDTLQALAKMDEKTRSVLIDKMVSDRILQQAIANSPPPNTVSNNQVQASGVSGSSFYFYNDNAVSQGYSDFRKKWGNRKLEDNWRRSNRSGSDITNNTANSIQGNDPDAPVTQAQANKNNANAGNYRQELIKGLPLTSSQLAQSNVRIYNAYIDVANFYRDIIGDKKEAIAEYELVLRRFPNDLNKPAIYYNLYRLYSETDPAKSDQYKNILIKQYPETPFAKVIIDPDFAKKLDDKDAVFKQAYNKVFDLYAHKKYKEVIDSVPDLLKQYPNNKYAAQLYYLKTIAEGHNEKLAPFQDSLKLIANNFPNDKLITPLINQHLAYINANQAVMANRDVVLTDDDPHDIPFTLDPVLKKETAYRRVIKQDYEASKPVEKLPEKKQAATTTQPVTTSPPAGSTAKVAKTDTTHQPVVATTVAQPDTARLPVQSPKAPQASLQTNNEPDAVPIVPSIFSMNDSTNYYFVVNVNSSTTNLSSSRFGIGQFNRVNYTGKGIKHELKAVGSDNQLIFVGRFLTLNGVKKYVREIVPLLPDIIKAPKDKYSFFIITQENLNKLADKTTLDSYIDYYQKNY